MIAVIYSSLKTDENQKKKQIKMHFWTWALCATVQKEKVYVLRLKLTHIALVNTCIWTIRHFDCGDELERDWKRKFLKMERHFSVGPDRPVKEDHLWRWTTLNGKFLPGLSGSIYVWTEISENFGIMESILRGPRPVFNLIAFWTSS